MASTGAVLLTGFSRFLGDELIVGGSATTGAGSTTTIVDSALARFDDDFLNDYYFRITEAGHGAIYQVRRATDFVSSTGTVTVSPAFGATTGSGMDYEIHRYDPAEKFTALDEARLRGYPALAQIIFNETLTGDGISATFPIPAALRRGPAFVQVEQPIEVNAPWNFLTNPFGDSTTNWTASNTTASVVSLSDADRLIPKYGESATKLATAASVNGTYSQTVANMTNDITAALAGGRRMTLAFWVYCRTASRVTLQLIDNTNTNSSAAHGGAGWELLTVTANIVSANATTLTARINVSSAAAAVDCWWNHAWLYFGEADRVTDLYAGGRSHRVRRDDTTQQLHLEFAPQRGRQLRLIGRDHLSALGTTAATQVTNTMEVDEAQAQLLYAEAAKILFARQGFSVDDFPGVAQRITEAELLRRDLEKRWSVYLPVTAPLKSAWAS